MPPAQPVVGMEKELTSKTCAAVGVFTGLAAPKLVVSYVGIQLLVSAAEVLAAGLALEEGKLKAEFEVS